MPHRSLTDHVVSTDQAHQLKVMVLDEPGPGGACHHYHVTTQETPPPVGGGMSPADFDKAEKMLRAVHDIRFQRGPIAEQHVNGLTNEVLLAILIDRLRGFQNGPYKCRENAIALTHLEESLMWLQKRTRERLARGVEGTSAP